MVVSLASGALVTLGILLAVLGLFNGAFALMPMGLASIVVGAAVDIANRRLASL